VQALLSINGKVVSLEGGLLVVSDKVEVLNRVSEMLAAVESAPADSWVVQLNILSMSGLDTHDLGVAIDPSAELALTFARASSGDPGSVLQLGGVLSAALHLARSSHRVQVLAQPLLTLVDGGTATHEDVRSIPTPKRVASPEGTVSTTDYERVDAGLIVKLTLRDMGSGRARLALSVELSDIDGYVESAPILAKTTYDTSAVVASGGVYLLGSLHQVQRGSGVEGAFRTVSTKDDRSRDWQVWARCYKIAGPVN
jgi:type II secretory pathway component GspD/PulD (secretin)